MLLPQNLASTQWAQSGYMKIGDQSTAFGVTGVHTFAQFTYACNSTNTCSGSSVKTFFGPAPTGSQFYSTYLRASDDRIAMYAGSTLLGEMNRSVTGEWSPQWGGQFMGETKNLESDVPGTSANHVRFNYIQKYDSAGNIDFIQNITTITPSSSRYHNTQGAADVGGRWLDIWTDPL